MSYFLPAFKNKYYCTYKIYFLAVDSLELEAV